MPVADDLFSHLLLRPPCTCSAVTDIHPSSFTTTSAANSSNSTLVSLQSHPSLPSLSSISFTNYYGATTHHLLSSFRPHRSPISALALSPDGTHLYTAAGGEVRVWDVSNSLSQLDAFNLSGDGAVKFLAFSNDGDGNVYTAHQDRRIRVWRPERTDDLSAGCRGRGRRRHQLVATLPTLHDRVARGVLPKNYVRVRRHQKRLWVEHADAVSGVAAAGGFVYTVSWDRTLKIWRRSDLRCVESVTAHDDAVNAVAVAGDGTVYTGSADGRIRAWRKLAGDKKHSLLATMERHFSGVNALALASGGNVLYSGAGDRSILVWERDYSAAHMKASGALRGHRGAVLSLAVASPNGGEDAVVVSGSEDKTVRVWQRRAEALVEGMRRYVCLAVLVGHGRAVRTVVVAPAPAPAPATMGEYNVCSGCLGGQVKLWRVQISPSSARTDKPLIKDSDNPSYNT